jgi:hypothetical protein
MITVDLAENLEFKADNGRLCPIVRCDFCNDRIKDGEMSVYLYVFDFDKLEVIGTVKFAHKGKCHDEIEDQLRSYHSDDCLVSWNNLNRFFTFLVNNTGIELENAKSD